MVKKILKYLVPALCLCALCSCNKDFCNKKDSYKELKVYTRNQVMPRNEMYMVLKSDGINLSSIKNFEFNVKVNRPINKDIEVTLGVDTSKVREFNKQNNTNYELLPDDVYSFNKELNIPKESYDDTVKVIIDSSKFKSSSNGYILPISIKSSDKGEVSSDFNTMYLIINTVLTNIEESAIPGGVKFVDRTNWKIESFSSQESSGEGPNNGRAIFCLDGNINTFWHTKWAGGFDPMPHYLVINMGAETKLRGISYVDRQNNPRGVPLNITISTSMDGNNWEHSYSYQSNSGNERKYLLFPETVTARFFRFKVTYANYGTQYTHLAELDAIAE